MVGKYMFSGGGDNAGSEAADEAPADELPDYLR